MNLSNFLENRVIDSIFRGGALAPAGTINSTAVAKGVWAATTAYNAGDVVVPPAGFTAGGGKFLQCTTAGTSGSTTTLACPAVGSTLTDGTVTWTAVSGMPVPLNLYVGLLKINKGARASSTIYALNDCISTTPTGGAGGDTRQHLYYCTTPGTSSSSQPTTYLGVPGEAVTDGTCVFTELSPIIDTGTGFPSGLTEVSGGSYARQLYAPTLANWAGTQSAGSVVASTGTTGTTLNNIAITFAAPSADWAVAPAAIGGMFLRDDPTAGNLLVWGAMTAVKTVANGDAAPSFAAAAISIQSDN